MVPWRPATTDDPPPWAGSQGCPVPCGCGRRSEWPPGCGHCCHSRRASAVGAPHRVSRAACRRPLPFGPAASDHWPTTCVRVRHRTAPVCRIDVPSQVCESPPVMLCNSLGTSRERGTDEGRVWCAVVDHPSVGGRRPPTPRRPPLSPRRVARPVCVVASPKPNAAMQGATDPKARTDRIGPRGIRAWPP